MLILSRRIGEEIVVGENIIITVTQIDARSRAVRIGIAAPKGVRIDRREVRDRINLEKVAG